MTTETQRRRLETAVVVIGYCMSRLDQTYLAGNGLKSWRAAFREASQALGVPPASLKNLRDEFDPLHPNERKGWHKRALRPNRQRVVDELRDVSDAALMALAERILVRDEDATVEAIDAMAVATRRPYNVAERLLTGRRAEEFFLMNVESMLRIPREFILDMRDAARGYDFGVRHDSETAIEIKGLKGLTGAITFTDREWMEACFRGQKYLVVVVGNLQATPVHNVIRDPRTALRPRSSFRSTIAVSWSCDVNLRA
ncbi:MAG: DUF3883 domain-containing protein [Planctomycetes bacterium]|nr:DUF3883 domain-containing protein [Planctomycetota bacterium]